MNIKVQQSVLDNNNYYIILKFNEKELNMFTEMDTKIRKVESKIKSYDSIISETSFELVKNCSKNEITAVYYKRLLRVLKPQTYSLYAPDETTGLYMDGSDWIIYEFSNFIKRVLSGKSVYLNCNRNYSFHIVEVIKNISKTWVATNKLIDFLIKEYVIEQIVNSSIANSIYFYEHVRNIDKTIKWCVNELNVFAIDEHNNLHFQSTKKAGEIKHPLFGAVFRATPKLKIAKLKTLDVGISRVKIER